MDPGGGGEEFQVERRLISPSKASVCRTHRRAEMLALRRPASHWCGQGHARRYIELRHMCVCVCVSVPVATRGPSPPPPPLPLSPHVCPIERRRNWCPLGKFGCLMIPLKGASYRHCNCTIRTKVTGGPNSHVGCVFANFCPIGRSPVCTNAFAFVCVCVCKKNRASGVKATAKHNAKLQLHTC